MAHVCCRGVYEVGFGDCAFCNTQINKDEDAIFSEIFKYNIRYVQICIINLRDSSKEAIS